MAEQSIGFSDEDKHVCDVALEDAWTSHFWRADIHQVVAARTGMPISWRQLTGQAAEESLAGAVQFGDGDDLVVIRTAREDVHGLIVKWKYCHEVGHVALTHYQIGKYNYGTPQTEHEADLYAMCCLLAYGEAVDDIYFAVVLRLQDSGDPLFKWSRDEFRQQADEILSEWNKRRGNNS
jgi:hypothetical protein